MKMGSLSNNKAKPFSTHNNHLPCTRIHQIVSLFLVLFTFFVIRLIDFLLAPSSCPHDDTVRNVVHASQNSVQFTDGGSLLWPQRGYGSHLSIKIYVYEENEIEGLKSLLYGRDGKVRAGTCLKGQWGTQVKIHRLLKGSRFRTRNKEEADLFFVPTYIKCVHMMNGLTEEEIDQTFIKVLSQMPYFRLSGGRNHIFVFPSGAGAHFFNSWEKHINRSIFLTPEADRTDRVDRSAFNTWKDVIIPGNVDYGMTIRKPAMVQPLPLSQRKYLANYLGHDQGKTGRLKLIHLAKQFPDKLEAPELKYGTHHNFERLVYFEHLRNAKFCLAPRGLSSWTLRFYEAFFVECVPVLLSDEVELPFQNVIDYTKMLIKWPSTEIGPQLLDYLDSIPEGEIERMIVNGRRVRCLWVYASETAPCSAMHGIMWELERKVRAFHCSTETFWLHNGSVVDRNLVQFSKWKTPLPLP